MLGVPELARHGMLPYVAAGGTVVAFLWVLTEMNIPSISSSLGAYYVDLVPGILVTFLGMLTASRVRDSPAVIGCFAFVGLGLAIIMGAAYGVGMVNAGMLGSASLEQAQAVTFVLALLLGGVVYFKG